MSLRFSGFVLLLTGSVALGVAFGELSFRLFLSAMPPAALGGFSQNSTHAAYWLLGAGAGLAIFVWALLAVVLAPLFKKRVSPARPD